MKVAITSCKNCRNIFVTSENNDMLLNGYTEEEISSIPIGVNEKIFFIFDEPQVKYVAEHPFEFEFFLTQDEIKCKSCGNKIGYHKQDPQFGYVGKIYKNKINVFKTTFEERKEKIGIASQEQCEALTNFKEMKFFCESMLSYCQEEGINDLGTIKQKIKEIEKLIDFS